MTAERANAFTMCYEPFELGGKRLYGTGYTVDHDMVPVGLYCYDVWSDGIEDSEEHIFVSRNPLSENISGAVISDESIDFHGENQMSVKGIQLLDDGPSVSLERLLEQKADGPVTAEAAEFCMVQRQNRRETDINFFKNRTVIGLLCIALSLVICFTITPMFNRMINEKTEIVRVTKNIRIGNEIAKDMVKSVGIGAYNPPESVVRDIDEVIGKYASADMAPGDYIIRSKVAEEPVAENAYLYNLNGEKQAISISVRAFVNGLSGKLVSGDIVSAIAPDYRKQGSTVIPPELQYVEVIAVTANSGCDANTGERGDEGTERELPGTMTLLVTPDQGRVPAELEADGKLHSSLVYRGTKENARKFVEAQEIMLEELYPPESEGMEENTEKESGTEETETVEEAGEETVQGEETEAAAGGESGVE